MAKLAKAAILLTVLATGCTPRIQLQWQDQVTRSKLNEVIEQTNNLEERVEALEAADAGGI